MAWNLATNIEGPAGPDGPPGPGGPPGPAGPPLILSDTAPPDPLPGTMWLETDTGNLFAWWEDPDSAAWVQVNVAVPAPVIADPVTLEMFGAQGENETADGAALAAAIAFLNSAGGGTIRCKAGRVYHINKLHIGGAEVPIVGHLRIDMNGSTFKRPDGGMTTNYCRMLWLKMTNGSSFEMFNGTIDANRTGNPGTAPGYEWQHNISVYLTTDAGVTVKWVKYRDLLLLDRETFDHLAIIPGTGSVLELAHIDNVRSKTTQPWVGRADVIWYRGIKRFVLENCHYLDAVESEFIANEDAMDTDVELRDSTIKRLDLGLTDTDYSSVRKRCTMERLRVQIFIAMAGAAFYTRNCDIILGGQAGAVRPIFWDCEDTTFHIPAAGWYMASIATNAAPTWRWRRNRVVLADGEAAPAASVVAMQMPAVTLAAVNKIDLTFEDCLFDLNDFDFVADPTGKTTWRRNIYKCKGAWTLSFLTGSRQQELTIENKRGGFANNATASVRLNAWNTAVATDFLSFSGDWEDGVDKPILYVGAAPSAAAKIMNRRVIYGTAPATTSLRGDTFKYINQPTGGATELVATISSGGSATWRATAWITNKAVTGSRPTLTASDLGVMHLDTTLDADGKPIWWTGTAWVDATGLVV